MATNKTAPKADQPRVTTENLKKGDDLGKLQRANTLKASTRAGKKTSGRLGRT